MEKLIINSYQLLKLITFFTILSDEIRAWTVEKGTLVPAAGARIHTDFQEGFIKADIMNWQDLVECGSDTKAREKGLVRTEGKDYEVQDGDIIHFKFAK